MRPVTRERAKGTGRVPEGTGLVARALAVFRRSETPVRRGTGPRKALRVERPGFQDRWRRGAAPYGIAKVALAALLLATGVYGAFAGGHVSSAGEAVRAGVSAAGRLAGFGLTELRVEGARRMGAEEIAERLGVGPGTILIGFDAAAARQRLLAVSWIRSASVRVLLPGTLEVTIAERDPFALWQRAGEVMLIDREGRVIGPYDDLRFSHLPLVVGQGAERRAGEIGPLLDPHPEIRSRVRAAVLVAERRWTLKLADGVDIMLPEREPATAIALVARLDRDSGLLNRDIAAVDLRLPDRVVVRLTDRAATQRAEMLRARSRLPAAQQPRPPVPPPAPPARPGRVT